MELLGAALAAGVLLLGGGLVTVYATRHHRPVRVVASSRAMEQRQMRDSAARAAVSLSAAVCRLDHGLDAARMEALHAGLGALKPGDPPWVAQALRVGLAPGADDAVATRLRTLRIDVSVEHRRVVLQVMLAVAPDPKLDQARFIRWTASALGVELAPDALPVTWWSGR